MKNYLPGYDAGWRLFALRKSSTRLFLLLARVARHRAVLAALGMVISLNIWAYIPIPPPTQTVVLTPEQIAERDKFLNLAYELARLQSLTDVQRIAKIVGVQLILRTRAEIDGKVWETHWATDIPSRVVRELHHGSAVGQYFEFILRPKDICVSQSALLDAMEKHFQVAPTLSPPFHGSDAYGWSTTMSPVHDDGHFIVSRAGKLNVSAHVRPDTHCLSNLKISTPGGSRQ